MRRDQNVDCVLAQPAIHLLTFVYSYSIFIVCSREICERLIDKYCAVTVPTKRRHYPLPSIQTYIFGTSPFEYLKIHFPLCRHRRFRIIQYTVSLIRTIH